MINGNIIIAIFTIRYLFFIFTILKKSNREHIQTSNSRIEELRSKPSLTLDEQKEFIRIKYNQYPNAMKFNLWTFVPFAVISVSLFLILMHVLETVLKISPNFWVTLISAIAVSLGINMLLRKFNMHRQDTLDVFFR